MAVSPSPPPKTGRPWGLVLGDALALLLFVLIGRRSHALLVADPIALALTAGPFLVGWFAVSPWFGLFRADVSRNWRRLLLRLPVASVVGGALALVLRAWLRGQAVSGIPVSFVVAGLGFSTLFLLVWRLGYVWWAGRQANRRQAA